MSYLVYPTIRGIGWPVKRNAAWDTLVQTMSSGRELRLSYWSNPVWHWELTYGGGQGGGDGYVKDSPYDLMPEASYTDLQDIQGFYNQVQGRFGVFLYDDVTPGLPPGQGLWDYVGGQNVATGDGTTIAFQLIRSIGGFTEAVQTPFMADGVSSPPNVYLNGVGQTYGSAFSINNIGQILFVTAPGSGVQISWSGSYYFPVRFDDDDLEFENFAQYLWSAKAVKLMQVRL